MLWFPVRASPSGLPGARVANILSMATKQGPNILLLRLAWRPMRARCRHTLLRCAKQADRQTPWQGRRRPYSPRFVRNAPHLAVEAELRHAVEEDRTADDVVQQTRSAAHRPARRQRGLVALPQPQHLHLRACPAEHPAQLPTPWSGEMFSSKNATPAGHGGPQFDHGRRRSYTGCLVSRCTCCTGPDIVCPSRGGACLRLAEEQRRVESQRPGEALVRVAARHAGARQAEPRADAVDEPNVLGKDVLLSFSLEERGYVDAQRAHRAPKVCVVVCAQGARRLQLGSQVRGRAGAFAKRSSRLWVLHGRTLEGLGGSCLLRWLQEEQC
jgi:hypothetical protein